MRIPVSLRARSAGRSGVGPVPEPGEVTLRARGLRVERDGRAILDGVDADVTAGEVLALVGPNGAGKSTLLAALAGDLPVADGVVELESLPLDGWTARAMARRRAVLPQQHRVGFGFTVEEIVRMGRAPWSRTDRAERDDEIVASALETCDVVGFGDRPFGALSGGEQARVALARVLAQQTPTMMLDEPTAALDLRHQESVMRIAAARAREGAAVVVVLHDLGLASAYADRVMVLHGGRVAADGPPERVFTDELLSAVYRHRVEVLPHPRGGRPLIVPHRPDAGAPGPRGTTNGAAAPDQPAVDPANWAEYSRA